MNTDLEKLIKLFEDAREWPRFKNRGELHEMILSALKDIQSGRIKEFSRDLWMTILDSYPWDSETFKAMNQYFNDHPGPNPNRKR